ncbi:MAG: hypothetical protein A2V98_12195 [Planctomycetes bacterium RBG_16_64_12]|nr:MAG: hypothetical protein A2V98_12195 [Planctomycetes bacterium RBG_16_64_12]
MIVRRYCIGTLSAMVLLLDAAWLEAQVARLPAVDSPSEPYQQSEVSSEQAAGSGQRADHQSSIINPDRPPDARDGAFQKVIFDSTWLDSGDAGGFGITQLELKSVFGLPIPSRRSPLLVTPGFAVHYLEGPAGADLPPQVYEATVQYRWWKRFTPQFGIDFSVTPGVFSDFQQGTDEAFRTPAHIAGQFEWTPAAKFIFGAAYLDRDDVNVLPIGGLVWTPREDLKLELVSPRPRIAHRVFWRGASTDEVQDWVYVAGEFGGGTWAIRRAAGADDVLTYRDFRLLLGLERKALGNLDARLEVGYVFSREIQYASSIPDIRPSDTVMLRAGLTY